MQYHCHGRPCSEEPALEIGDWVMSLADLLKSSVCSEGTVVNEALLKHLQNLVEHWRRQVRRSTPGMVQAQQPAVEGPGADSHPLPAQIHCPYQG